MLTVDTLRHLAADELVQLAEEGCDTRPMQEIYQRALAMDDEEQSRAALTELFALAEQARPERSWPWHEPSDLPGIRAARPEAERGRVRLDDESLRDRLLGAWLGRCIGCMVGKPVEGRRREEIEALLRAADAWPLTGYFPVIANPPEGVPYRPADDPCLAPNITRSVRDDDTDYSVLGLHLIENFGASVSPEQIVREWLVRLPYHRTYTAERAAMRNWVNEIMPPRSAAYMNPYREWIGAQIRADGWAWCAAGWPEVAAEYCWRDACITHTKNGIYGEMFFGALIAACFGTDDLHQALELALAEIPEQCRLAAAVRECIAWCAEDASWEQTWDRIMTKYGHYHPVHTINNALLCVMGLLHSGGDLRRAVCIAVMGGLDTDCNGATVGSVMGALLGASAVPEDLRAPLNDTLETALSGMAVLRISDLVDRTWAVVRKTLD